MIEALARLAAAAALTLSIAASVQAEVPDNAADVRPLLTGAKAPEFSAVAADGSQFTFNPDALEKPAIITFYRGGWCPYCNLHWAELRKIEDQLLELGMDLIFLSADSAKVLADAVEPGEELPYHLLSDASTSIAEAFGIAFQLDDETVERYKNYDLDLEAISGYDHHRLPAPAVFLVDLEGKISFQYVNPDYSVRLHPDVLLAAARTMPGRKLKR